MQNSTIQWLAALLAFCLLLGVAPAAAVPAGIQEQIDAASPGDTIYVDSGTYYENVVVDKQVTLIGNDTGDGLPIVDGDDWDNTFTVTADGVVIEGFEITGSYDSCPYAGISVEADDVVIRNNVIVDNGGHGIWVDEVTGTLVEGNEIGDNGLNGIAVDYATGTIIRGNEIYGSDYNEIRVYESTDTTIDQNTVTGYSDYYGIHLEDVYGIVVSDNTVQDCSDTGIYLYYFEGTVITGNTVTGNGWDDHKPHGIFLEYYGGDDAATDPTLIADNTVTGSYAVGINAYDVDYVVVTGNEVIGNGKHGILLGYCDNAVVSENVALGNGVHGIKVIDSDGVTVTDNTARLNGYHGFMLDGSYGAVISGNTFTDNAIFGLVLREESGGNIITENTASGVYSPIMLSSSCLDNEIYLNDFLFTDVVIEPPELPMPMVTDQVIPRTAEETGMQKEEKTDKECGVPGKEKKNPVVEFILGFLPREIPVGDDTVWNSPEAWWYQYNNDGTARNFTGNYWYDYNGTDANGDGIGDTPYEILLTDCDESEEYLGDDLYPLMGSYTLYAEVEVLAPTGGSGNAQFDFTGDGTVLTSSEGKVLREMTITSGDGIAELTLPRDTVALDGDGNPLTEITITALGEVPEVPEGAVFTFAGYAYECTPAGATFAPAITLTFTLSEEEWEALEGDLSVRFYNEETGLWEDVPATYDPATHTVTATVSHFTVFALFAEASGETAPAAETTTAEPTATTEPAETTAAPAETTEAAEPEETPESPLVFAPVLGVLAFLFFARRH